MANPTLLDMPIARDGNKNAIPTTDNGTTGLLSQQYGWQLINAIPPQQGGKAVKREDFNGALYLLSNLLFYLQKGWQFEWDSSQTYYAGCIVKDTSDNKMYQCLNDVTSTTAPHSDSVNWKLWDLSMLANYLPLAGGKMTGPYIYRNTNTDYLTVCGGTLQKYGGSIAMIGSSNGNVEDGGVIIKVANADESLQEYVIQRDGTSVQTDLGYRDLGGASIVSRSLTPTGYIKFASGLILQWGEVKIASGATESATITYPLSFNTTHKTLISCETYYNYGITSSDMYLNIYSDGIEKVKAITSQQYDRWAEWFAIGY